MLTAGTFFGERVYNADSKEGLLPNVIIMGVSIIAWYVILTLGGLSSHHSAKEDRQAHDLNKTRTASYAEPRFAFGTSKPPSSAALPTTSGRGEEHIVTYIQNSYGDR